MTEYNRFTTPPRVIFERVSASENLRRYTQHVRNFLAEYDEEPRLSDDEYTMVRRGWATGERYRLIASLIRTDRFLQGAGRKKT